MTRPKVKTVGEGGTFDEVISQSPDRIKEIARAARSLLAEVLPGITEVPWSRQRVVGYGVGPKKMSEHFCYISPHKNHVNLGFLYGADLADPLGFLEGHGKLLRHVKLASIDDVRRPGLRDLVHTASRHLPKLKT